MSDRIISMPANDAYRRSWDRIWGKESPRLEDYKIVGMDLATEPDAAYVQVRDASGGIVAERKLIEAELLRQESKESQ